MERKKSLTILSWIGTGFDHLYASWEQVIVRKYMGPLMVFIYLGYLVLIELNLRGLLCKTVSGYRYSIIADQTVLRQLLA